MDKIYIIKTSGGDCDDYWTRNHKAFYRENDANDYLKKYNGKLANKREMIRQCCNCPADFDDFMSAEDKDSYLVDASQKCERSKLHRDSDGLYICDNELGYWDCDESYATIEVMEIK